MDQEGSHHTMALLTHPCRPHCNPDTPRRCSTTIGEVDNARELTLITFFVVDGITWWRKGDGSVQADGGDVRCWRGWAPSDVILHATKFRYELPSGGTQMSHGG